MPSLAVPTRVAEPQELAGTYAASFSIPAGSPEGTGGVEVWLVAAGWWLALTHIVTGLALCLTIIGIPLGIANFKLIPVTVMPLGKQIVSRP